MLRLGGGHGKIFDGRQFLGRARETAALSSTLSGRNRPNAVLSSIFGVRGAELRYRRQCWWSGAPTCSTVVNGWGRRRPKCCTVVNFGVNSNHLRGHVFPEA